MDVRSVMDVRAGQGILNARTASSLEAAASAVSATDIGASNSTPVRVPQYLSPVYKYDSLVKLSILAFRDVSNGEVKEQFPAEKVVEEYRRNWLLNGGRGTAPGAEVAAARAKAAAQQSETEATSGAGGSEAASAGGPVPGSSAVPGTAPAGPVGTGSGVVPGYATGGPGTGESGGAALSVSAPVASTTLAFGTGAPPVFTGGGASGNSGRIVSIKV